MKFLFEIFNRQAVAALGIFFKVVIIDQKFNKNGTSYIDQNTHTHTQFDKFLIGIFLF